MVPGTNFCWLGIQVGVYCPPHDTMCNSLCGVITLCFNTSYTGWGKIPSLISVGHCEGRGGRRRVGLGSKGAGSWEVPVRTLCSRKDGVVQRAAHICRRNLLFAKSLYRSGATCVPYSTKSPPRDRVPDRKSILLWVENFREMGSVSEKR